MELIDIGLNLMHKSYDKDRIDVINEAKSKCNKSHNNRK